MSFADLHFITRFRQQAQTLAHQPAIYYQDQQQQWQAMNWSTFQQEIDQLSLALLANQISVQDKIGIFAANMPRWTMADIASLQIRAITVPIYATDSAKQAAFIINNADIKILFVGDQEQYDKILSITDDCPQLEKIVLMKDNIDPRTSLKTYSWRDFISTATAVDLQQCFNERLAQRCLEDLFTLIYTSGTTGEPKGVMLDYANLAHQLAAHDQAFQKTTVTTKDKSLSFLPFSHIFERAWVAYIFHRGAVNCYLEDPHQIREALSAVKPSLMCAVPRFYEKIYAAVLDKVQQAPLIRRAIFKWAMSVGHKRFEARRQKRRTPLFTKLQYPLADKLVISKLRHLLGGKIRMMPCGGAKLDPSIGAFFHSIGINIKLGYGMTETTATVSCWDDDHFELNSIGTLMPNVEVKIGENNEILVRGGMVMRGYYKKPQESADSFTADGFLKTGDAGALDAQGNLFITDRIKELMKTSNGKYIAPQYIESTVGKDKFIEQIAVIADAKKYVSALIVPCFNSLEEYAKQLNIKYHDRLELIKHSDILKMFEQRINELQKELPSFEQIKKFTLLPQAFTTKMEEITPTLKLRRKVILERYKTQIEAMYKEYTHRKEK